MNIMYNSLDKLRESHNTIKQDIEKLLSSYGISVDSVTIHEPKNIHDLAEKGLEVSIVSRDFEKMGLFTKTGLMSKISLELGSKILPKGYTPEEFEKLLSSVIALTALSEDKSILSKTKQKKTGKLQKFSIKHYIAKEVFLVGDMNNWRISPVFKLTKHNNTFSLYLPLKKGTYKYKFVVDGMWIKDPKNPNFEKDNFGGQNSILIVD